MDFTGAGPQTVVGDGLLDGNWLPRDITSVPLDGGVLVSTFQIRQRRHAEDGSLAS